MSTTEEDLKRAKEKFFESKRKYDYVFKLFENATEEELYDNHFKNLSQDKRIRLDFTNDDYNDEYKEYVKNITDKDDLKKIEISDFMNLLFDYKQSLSELKNVEINLRQQTEQSINFLEKKVDGNIILEDIYETSVLDNYRNWGIDRICIDGFQNHLPGDSMGTVCCLQFLVDDEWVDVEKAKLNKSKITKVRFADNGVGFDSKNLQFLSSQKSSEDFSAGQFGEGLKLIAMSSVNLGLDMEVQSKNWIAKAFGKKQFVKSYRDGEKELEHKQLAWNVTSFDGEPIQGSRTIFNSPSPEFIEYALKLPDLILELSDKNKRKIFYNDFLVEGAEPGYLFCKGMFVQNINSFFSYNFLDEELNPDRNQFKRNIKNIIRYNITRSHDYQVIRMVMDKILDYYQNNPDLDNLESPLECKLYEFLNKFIESKSEYDYVDIVYTKFLFKKAFEDHFEEIAKKEMLEGVALKTDYKIPEYMRESIKKFKIISLPKEWTDVLIKIGIKTDKDIIPDYQEEDIKTSISLDYGDEIWDTQRIFLDACQNHLPSDSGGTDTFVKFQAIDGNWYDYRDLPKFSDNEIKKIKIFDNGKGYDYNSLGVFVSAKNNDDSSGKWGEGLKMISASAIRNGIKMELHSRNWTAVPYVQDEVLNEGESNEKEFQRLCFKVKVKIKEDINNDTASKDNEMSSTTFIDPTPELISNFRDLENSVLYFSSQKPRFSVDDIDFLDYMNGKLYIRNILIPGDHNLKYSYNLKNFDIQTRDRNTIENKSMKEQIAKILEETDDTIFLKFFLADARVYAEGIGNEKYLEFNTDFKIPSGTEKADIWIKTFQDYFGENACIRSMRDLNYSEAKAQHMGLKTISLPDELASTLLNLRGTNGQKIISYKEALNEAINNAIPVDDKDLTTEEIAIINQLYKYNEILFLDKKTVNKIEKINVYEYAPDYHGEKAAGFAGLGNTINICRKTLERGLLESADVFFHEADHAQNGADDEAPAFRDYLSSLLASMTVATFPLEQSIVDNGLVKGLGFSKFKNLLKKIFWKKVIDKNDEKNVEDEFGEELGEV